MAWSLAVKKTLRFLDNPGPRGHLCTSPLKRHMAEPTLTEVFGAAATQTATTLTISKANLAAVGLTASATNTAESLLIALVLQAALQLTETARTGDYASRNVTVYSGGTDLPVQGGNTYRRDQFSILAYRAETLTPVDPDNY